MKVATTNKIPPHPNHTHPTTMLENIIVAATNLHGVWAIRNFSEAGDVLRAAAVLAAMLSSIVYHLFEHQKHHMPGMGIFGDKKSHEMLIMVDRVCALFAITFCATPPSILGIMPISIISAAGVSAMIMSELVAPKLPPRHDRLVHIVFHSIWHLCAFEAARRISILGK